MLNRVRNIQLVLENCEGYVIPAGYLEVIEIKDIRREIINHSLSIVASVYRSNDIFLKINPAANASTLVPGCQCYEKLFDRVVGNSITNIVINYYDGSNETIYVDWFDDESQYNENEVTMVHTDSSLIIVVCRDKVNRLEEILERFEE